MSDRPEYASPACWLHEFDDLDAPHPLRWRRVYDAPSPEDGYRVFIDRLWPRGIKKEALAMDAWAKDVAPSPALRKWFGHRPERWAEFCRRYRAELDGRGDLLRTLAIKTRDRPVTFLIAARQPVHNHAVALLAYLRDKFHLKVDIDGGPASAATKASAAASSGVTKPDFELLAEFRYRLRKFLGFSERAAVAHGVTPHQYQALLAIEGFPGRDRVTIGELAEQMQIAHHTAVELVNRMERLKLVRRTPSKEDRRQVHVSLTAKGLGILEKLYREHRAELRLAGPQIADLLRRAVDGTPD